jgi:hypothetical protein
MAATAREGARREEEGAGTSTRIGRRGESAIGTRGQANDHGMRWEGMAGGEGVLKAGPRRGGGRRRGVYGGWPTGRETADRTGLSVSEGYPVVNLFLGKGFCRAGKRIGAKSMKSGSLLPCIVSNFTRQLIVTVGIGIGTFFFALVHLNVLMCYQNIYFRKNKIREF